MKFDQEFRDPSKMHWTRDLNEEELNVLEEWVEKYEKTYKLAGYIKDDGKLKIWKNCKKISNNGGNVTE